MTHALKTWPEYYKTIISGEKTFDIRKDDRMFRMDDILLLQEYDPISKIYTGKEKYFSITFILRDSPDFGLKEGYCILSIKPKE